MYREHLFLEVLTLFVLTRIGKCKSPTLEIHTWHMVKLDLPAYLHLESGTPLWNPRSSDTPAVVLLLICKREPTNTQTL